jgi:lysylphosphatidylglycerol synthetase-like protein (DUF2156 family)
MVQKTEGVEMQKGTWTPPAAGILCIIAGVLGIIIGTVAAAMDALITMLPVTPEILARFIWVFGAAPIVLGIVAIIGGTYALLRRRWGLALSGCICSLLCVFPLLPAMILGILAIIFVGIGKREFE